MKDGKYKVKIIPDIADIMYTELEVPSELYKDWVHNKLAINMDICYCKFDSEKAKIPVESLDFDNIFYEISEIESSNLFKKTIFHNYEMYSLIDDSENRAILLSRKALEEVSFLEEIEENHVFKIIIDTKGGFSIAKNC